jgi:hypothetical protein
VHPGHIVGPPQDFADEPEAEDPHGKRSRPAGKTVSLRPANGR